MDQCLLCQQTMLPRLSFRELFLLKDTNFEVCKMCQSEFEPIKENHCPRCYKSGEQDVCIDCQIWERKGIKVKHQSLYRYNSAMKAFFSQYKFQGDYLLRYVFKEEIKQHLAAFQKTHTIIPVPLGEERLYLRGFNQVTGFLDAANIHYSDVLEKENTIAQSSKARMARLDVTQTFNLKPNSHLTGKILIVDDIYTTGATINQIRQLLQANGIKEIESFSLAR